jgi:ketosteroid isomerase-like protein
MTSPEDALRARRKTTNRLIESHQAERLAPFFMPDAVVIAGDGGRIMGAAQIIAAFADQFAEPGFGAFVRTTEAVALDGAGERAAEHGAWLATRKDGAPAPSGTYLAAWRKVRGQWLIESELFITLSQG